jgi:hypothetical protein
MTNHNKTAPPVELIEYRMRDGVRHPEYFDPLSRQWRTVSGHAHYYKTDYRAIALRIKRGYPLNVKMGAYWVTGGEFAGEWKTMCELTAHYDRCAQYFVNRREKVNGFWHIDLSESAESLRLIQKQRFRKSPKISKERANMDDRVVGKDTGNADLAAFASLRW